MKETVSKDGTVITYKQTGQGQPVIMIDGAFCSHLMGPSVKGAPLLARDFTVISYDRRGRNGSGDNPPYSVEKEIEDIDALIQIGGGPVYVFGQSSGAALALLAYSTGLDIEKMFLYEPPYSLSPGPEAKDAYGKLRSLIAAGQRGDAVKYFLKDLARVPSLAVFFMQFTPFWSGMKKMAHTLPYEAAIMDDTSLPVKKAKSVKIPTCIACGEKSGNEAYKTANALSHLIPEGRTAIIKGQDHQVDMKVLVPVIASFFKAGLKIEIR